MNVKQLDVKRLVAASRNLKLALCEAKACMDTIEFILKINTQKDSKLKYLYEEEQ